jgi:MtaA/CmuA family methyltransferase
MNGYQRIKAALNGEWPDKRPIMLHNFMLATREAGYSMKQYREDPQVAANVHIQAVEKYGLDGILFDVDTVLLAGAIGVPVDFPEDDPARSHKPLIRSLEEVDMLAPIDIEKNERIQMALEAVRILKKYFGDEIFIRGNIDQAPFSLASMVRTPAEFMMDLIVNEEKVFQLLDYCLKACLQFAQMMATTGAHMISNGDSTAGPEMISSDMYEKFALPYEKKLADYAHGLGLPYLIHICGNTNLILHQMAKTGIDAIELDYKTDIHEIHALYKDSITLFGTIDPSKIIANGTPLQVENKTKELLDVYYDSPRLVINAGCAIPPTAPEENIRKMISVTREAM